MMTNTKSAKVYTFSIGGASKDNDVVEDDDSGRCQYIDNKNIRCKWNVDKGGKYCTQHRYMYRNQ